MVLSPFSGSVRGIRIWACHSPSRVTALLQNASPYPSSQRHWHLRLGPKYSSGSPLIEIYLMLENSFDQITKNYNCVSLILEIYGCAQVKLV